MNNENENTNIQVVMVKYIKGGKEVVKYDTTNGNCWVESITKDTIVTKVFNINSPKI
jgi:hypothetical protein